MNNNETYKFVSVISGQVGDWKNWFTVGQSDMFDNYYKEKMKTSGVKIKFTLWEYYFLPNFILIYFNGIEHISALVYKQ